MRFSFPFRRAPLRAETVKEINAERPAQPWSGTFDAVDLMSPVGQAMFPMIDQPRYSMMVGRGVRPKDSERPRFRISIRIEDEASATSLRLDFLEALERLGASGGYIEPFSRNPRIVSEHGLVLNLWSHDRPLVIGLDGYPIPNNTIRSGDLVEARYRFRVWANPMAFGQRGLLAQLSAVRLIALGESDPHTQRVGYA